MGIFGNLVYAEDRPRFIGKPIEDLKESSALLDSAYRQNKAKIDSLDILEANLDVLDADYGYKKNQIEQTRGILSNALEQGDLQFQGAAVDAAYKDFATNKGLQYALGSKTKRDQYVAGLQKKVDDGDISQSQASSLIAYFDNNYSGIKEENGIYSGLYSGYNPGKQISFDKLIFDLLGSDGFKADVLGLNKGSGSYRFIEGEGGQRYIETDNGTMTIVREKDVMDYVQKYLANDPDVQRQLEDNIMFRTASGVVNENTAGAILSELASLKGTDGKAYIDEKDYIMADGSYNIEGINRLYNQYENNRQLNDAIANAANRYGKIELRPNIEIKADTAYNSYMAGLLEKAERVNMTTDYGPEKTVNPTDLKQIGKTNSEIKAEIDKLTTQIQNKVGANGQPLTQKELEEKQKQLKQYNLSYQNGIKSLDAINKALKKNGQPTIEDRISNVKTKSYVKSITKDVEAKGLEKEFDNLINLYITGSKDINDVTEFIGKLYNIRQDEVSAKVAYMDDLGSALNKQKRRFNKSLDNIKDVEGLSIVDRNWYITSADKDMAEGEKKSTYVTDLMNGQKALLESGASFSTDYGLSVGQIFSTEAEGYTAKEGDAIPDISKSKIKSVVFNPDGRVGVAVTLANADGKTLYNDDKAGSEAKEVIYMEKQDQALDEYYNTGRRAYLYGTGQNQADGFKMMAQATFNEVYQNRIDALQAGQSKDVKMFIPDGKGSGSEMTFRFTGTESGESFTVKYLDPEGKTVNYKDKETGQWSTKWIPDYKPITEFGLSDNFNNPDEFTIALAKQANLK